MQTLPTAAELLERFRLAAEAQLAGRTRTDGSPYRIRWTATSLPNVIRTAAVRLAQRALWVIDREFRASFLDTAEDDDLDAWAASEAPGFPRKAASAALTTLALTRATALTSGTIRAGSRFTTVATATSPAATFTSLADVTVSVGAGLSGSPVLVDVECESDGPSGNVDEATITRSLTALFATFTVTNPARAAGGDTVEGDDDYRNRLRQRDARYRRGTVAAVELGALSVPGVSRVYFADPQTDTSIAAGTFRLVIGDQRGIGSQPLADRVNQVLSQWASEGIGWEVLPAGTQSVITSTPTPVPASSVALRFDVTRRRTSGTFDQVGAERDIRLALVALSTSLDHGQPLHLMQLATAVLRTNPLLRNVRVVGLAADGSELGALTGDWPAPTLAASRWDFPDAVLRFQWGTE